MCLGIPGQVVRMLEGYGNQLALVDVAGEPCVLVAAIDVTERKREERLLYRIAEGVAGETGERLFRSLVGHLADVLACDIALCGEVVG